MALRSAWVQCMARAGARHPAQGPCLIREKYGSTVADMADTTVLLLLIVFAIVNVCALVLRREDVSHDHFRAPTAMPVIGAIVSVAVMTTKDADTFARAGALLGAGVLLWLVSLPVRKRG